MVIAGIGSRETPQDILKEMFKIGLWVQSNNHWLRSGHADGADWSFESASDEKCIIYLPWLGFNSHLSSKAQKFYPNQVSPTFGDYNEFTDKFHPNPSKLSKTARAFMNRNVCQVLGLKLNSPCDFVICWTKDGKDSGGTGQALRIAKHYNIPILNMYHNDYNTADKCINFILNFPK
jgi:hypothetical protein